jgi:hypothetical protein
MSCGLTIAGEAGMTIVAATRVTVVVGPALASRTTAAAGATVLAGGAAGVTVLAGKLPGVRVVGWTG